MRHNNVMEEKTDLLACRIADELLRVGAIAISLDKPFSWASGVLSPFYCDNRITLSYPSIRRMLTDAFVEKASKYEFDCVAGVATAGIAHAALLAERLDMPLIYIRGTPKKHGRCNQIEGHLPKEARVLLIEDLVATGYSSLLAAEAVKKVTGSMPVRTLAIFSYQLKGVAKLFQAKGSPLETLSNFGALLKMATKAEYITPELHASLLEWRKDYQTWMPKNIGE